MRRTINLKKGLNMRLEGSLGDTAVAETIMPDRIAIVPDDFPGFLPKLDVKEGDEVSLGSPLMHDKNDTAICLVTPVAGIVESIVRGPRRKIERVVKPHPKLLSPTPFRSPTVRKSQCAPHSRPRDSGP